MRMSLLNIFWSLPSPLLFMRNLKRQTSLKLSTHGRKNLFMLCFSKKMFGIFTRGHFNNSKNCILRFYYVFNTIKNSSSITQYRGIRIALPIVAQHDKKTVVHQWKSCYIYYIEFQILSKHTFLSFHIARLPGTIGLVYTLNMLLCINILC